MRYGINRVCKSRICCISQEKILKSHAWKMAIFRAENAWKMAIFQDGICPGKVKRLLGKSHPGNWPFSRANSNLDFSNSGWKMAIFQAWIFQIPGGKWPFSRPGFFKFGMENSHFPRQIPTWIFQILGGKWPFSMHGILRIFPWPRFFKFRVENPSGHTKSYGRP